MNTTMRTDYFDECRWKFRLWWIKFREPAFLFKLLVSG
jgi:hypothetical protein